MIVSVNADPTVNQDAGEETHLAELFRHGEEAFFAFDRAWRFTFANKAATELLGKSGDQLIGIELDVALPGMKDSALFKPVVEAMSTRRVHESRLRFPGSRHEYVVRCLPIENGLA